MTPVLCLNCGKARSEHTGVAYGFCHDWPELTEWREPTEIEQRVIEQRTAEQIADFIDALDDDVSIKYLRLVIRGGAWKEKP